jgi:hypothetical protein
VILELLPNNLGGGVSPFSSGLPVTFRDNTSGRQWPLPSKSVPIHYLQSSYHWTLCPLDNENVKLPSRCSPPLWNRTAHYHSHKSSTLNSILKYYIQSRSSNIISWRSVLIKNFTPIHGYFSHVISCLHAFRGIVCMNVFLLFRLCQRICPRQRQFELFRKILQCDCLKVPQESFSRSGERER